ncbi:dephospho-CoA kinase [bacterium]|nr:dephospho-CoA kinase [bacterium]
MIVVGITGKIGTGKSTVAATFKDLGAQLLDADRIGKEALEKPDTKSQLVERFGDEILEEDGSISTEKIAEIVFHDDEARKYLEEITHPYIRRVIKEELSNLEAHRFPGLAVIDAALLPKWEDIMELLDYLILVDAPTWQRTNRLLERGYSRSDIEARISVQNEGFDKEFASILKRRVNFVIKNNGDLPVLRSKAVKVWHAIKRMGKPPKS